MADVNATKWSEKAMEPTFDGYGYPTEETLRKIERWSHTDGFENLLKYVDKAWNKLYGSVIIQSFDDSIVYRFITGGWSGNESIINALANNHVFWSLSWLKSERGGVHEFRVVEIIEK